MKDIHKKILIFVILISVSQILAVLFNFQLSLALVFALLASLYYFVDTGDISLEEALTGISGFILSSFAVSATGKILVLNGLCETAKSMNQTGAPMAGAVSPEQVCKGFFEAWVSALTSNPVQNWYMWIISIGVGATTAYLYRRHGEWK